MGKKGPRRHIFGQLPEGIFIRKDESPENPALVVREARLNGKKQPVYVLISTDHSLEEEVRCCDFKRRFRRV